MVPRRGPPRLSIFTLKSATWRACGHALDLPRARSAAPLLQNLIVCCCCAIQAPRRPGLGSRGVRRRSIPRLDMLFEPFQPALCEREARHIHEIGACRTGFEGPSPANVLPPTLPCGNREDRGSGLRCHTATGSTNLRCGVPYIPTFPYDDSDSRRWFLCDSATCLLVAGVDTLGGREGENPRRAVRRSARSARRARSYRLAKLSYERG